MLSELPLNIVLLLLQIILARQEDICRGDKDKNIDQLLQDPILDNGTLQQFITHPLVQIYSPQVKTLTQRKLRALVAEIFENGFHVAAESSAAINEVAARFQNEAPPTVVTLANFYYELRILQLERDLIPTAKESLLELVQ